MWEHDNNLARDIGRVLTAIEGTTKSITQVERELGIPTCTVSARDLAECIFQCCCCSFWVSSDLKWDGDLCEGCVMIYGRVEGECLIAPPLFDEEES